MEEKKVMGFVMLIALILGVMVTSCESKYVKCAKASPLLVNCVPYFGSSRTWPPPKICCEGAAQAIRDSNVNTESRRIFCECLKSYTAFYHFDPVRVKGLPEKCNITPSFPVDPLMDCNSIP
ncbi:non-specific lipid-transfer protein AP10-like [Abrus precatorius]|uniref:Non-specific lipid-transfer protein AP10-like n=1 Tax=Abrus precatorius TaxID=3816 RepID=A0A8B8KQ01_ABRPR|nr:non-specific lipid-transfer protein AP10-like [Abrus precatorius]